MLKNATNIPSNAEKTSKNLIKAVMLKNATNILSNAEKNPKMLKNAINVKECHKYFK